MAKTLRKGPERRKVKRFPIQCPTERQEQDAVIKWAKMMVATGQEPRLKLLRCGFEGIRLNMGQRMMLKRQSISTGWPDIFLAVPMMHFGLRNTCRDHMGLYIELKRRKGGVVSQEQRDLCVLLMEQGYEVCFCKGADEAIETIKQYLGMTD